MQNVTCALTMAVFKNTHFPDVLLTQVHIRCLLKKKKKSRAFSLGLLLFRLPCTDMFWFYLQQSFKGNKMNSMASEEKSKTR